MDTKKRTKPKKLPARKPPAKKVRKVWNGAPQLAPLLVPISQLVADPKNARTHDQRNLDAIAASLEAFGQVKPIVARTIEGSAKSVQLIAGHGTATAAKQLGWTHLAAVVSGFTDDTARAFGVADNRTAELATWDLANLAEVLADLEDLSDAMGFTAEEIEQLAQFGDDVAAEDEDEDEPADDAPAPLPPAASDKFGADLEEQPDAQHGDVWKLGRHLLRCNAEAKGKAMWLGIIDALFEPAANFDADPAWCDIIVDRWEAITGHKATTEKDPNQ